ncbi:MAG: phage tail protein [Minisyncoccota bacterium]
MFRKFLVALTVSTALTAVSATPAQAAPVFLAVAAFAASPLGAIVVNLVVGIGVSLLAGLLKPKQEERPPQSQQSKPFGMQLQLDVGGNNPIAFQIGTSATAGQLIYPGVWGQNDGTPNAYLVMEILLSDLPCPDNPEIWIGTQKCTINWAATPTTQGYPVTEFNSGGLDHVWVQFDDGTQTTASSYMTAKFGSHAKRPYSSDMVGRGQATVRVTALWNRELFNGAPEFLFETSGIPLYNIAKDTSVGGSGLHRWADTATWEPSDNPVVQAYNIRRGIFYGAEWVYGGNNKKALSANRLPASNWIAAINACDTAISLSGGGTEPQFRSGGIVTGDMQPADVIEQLLNSCNGRMAEVGGVYKVHVGSPGSSVYSFADDNIVITDGQSFHPFPALEDTHNAIEATYPEPDEKWGTKDAPGRYNTDWETEDGGRQLVASATFPMVPYKYQVQRLMQALINDARRFRNHVITLPPDAFVLEPNDVVSWTSTRNGYVAKKFLVTSITGKRGFNQAAALKEIDPSDYDWVPATDQQSVTTGELTIERPAPQLMAGWQAAPATIRDSDYTARRPSIEVSYNGEMADVRAIRVQVRLAATGAVIFDGEHPYDAESSSSPSVLSVVLNGTFLPDTDYEVRGKYIPFSGRTTYWSNQSSDGTEGPWLTVTTPDIRTSFTDLDAAIAGYNEWIGVNLRELIDDAQLRSVIGADQDLANYEDKQNLRTELRAGDHEVTANYIESILLAVGMDGTALADAIAAVETASGNITAGVVSRFTALASPGGGWARYGVQVRAASGTTWPASASLFMEAKSTGESRIVLQSDETFVVDSAGNVLAAYISDGTVAYARIPIILSDKIAAGAVTAAKIDAGAVTADKISVASLEAISATLGNVIVTGSLIVDGSIITSKYSSNSIIVAGFATNVNDFALSTSFTDVSSVTITGNGGKTVVIISCAANGGADAGFRLAVAKNGAIQIDEEVTTVLSGKFGNGTLTWVDSSPGQSASTYSCYARTTGGGLTHIFSSVVAENHKNA